MNSKELWLFNSRKMNDYMETTWIEHLVKEVIEENTVSNNILKNLKTFYKMDRYNTYLMCFSKKETF
jgi:hypothetical protein